MGRGGRLDPGARRGGSLLLNLPYLAARQPSALGLARTAEASDDVRAMLLLTAVIGFRSVAWFGLLTFMPLWVVSLGDSKAQGNHLLALMLLAGAVGRSSSALSPTDSGCAGRFSSRKRSLPLRSSSSSSSGASSAQRR